jgi:hypothetical protein
MVLSLLQEKKVMIEAKKMKALIKLFSCFNIGAFKQK